MQYLSICGEVGLSRENPNPFIVCRPKVPLTAHKVCHWEARSDLAFSWIYFVAMEDARAGLTERKRMLVLEVGDVSNILDISQVVSCEMYKMAVSVSLCSFASFTLCFTLSNIKSSYNPDEALNILYWGSDAPLVQFLCVRISCLYAVWAEHLDVCRAEWRRCIQLRMCCSTSSRLNVEIRSGASLSPLLSSSSSVFLFPLFSCPLIFHSLCSNPHPYFFPPCSRVQSLRILLHPSPLSDYISFLGIILPLSVSFLLSPPLILSHAHICDQIMRRIMGLLSLMAGIKVGEQRGGWRGLMSISW